MDRLTLILVGPLLLLASCSRNIDTVKNYKWKFDHGYHIGDVLDFGIERYGVNEAGEITVLGEFVATVMSVSGHELIISHKGETGRYVCFGEATTRHTSTESVHETELNSIKIHSPDRTPEENINLQNEVFSDSFLMMMDSVAKKKK